MAEYGGLFFVIGADVFKRFDIRPQTAAFFTFVQRRFADLDEAQMDPASGAITVFLVGDRGRHGLGTAAAAVLAAEKHQPKTGWAGDGFQRRAAKLTRRFVG